MKNRTNRILAALLASASAAAASLAGCSVDTNPYLTITSMNAVEVGDNGCKAGAGLTPPFVFDAGIAQQEVIGNRGLGNYLLSVTVATTLPPNDDGSTDDKTLGRVNSNRIQLKDILVEIDTSDPWGFLPPEATAQLTQVIDGSAAYSSLVTLLDPVLAKVMVTTAGSPIDNPGEAFPLNLTLRARGLLLDGTEVESNPVPITLNVCNNCLEPSETPEFDICPPPDLPQGCSYAQPDGFLCVTPE